MLFIELTCLLSANLLSLCSLKFRIMYLEWEKNIIVGVIYRPPGTVVNECNILVNEILSKIQMEGKICYLMGDYNINLFNYDVHSPTAELVDLMYSHSFVPLINRPTRITNQSATLIDNIFTNNYLNLCQCMEAVLVTDISDHFPVVHINWNYTADNSELYIKERSNNHRKRQAFSQAIQNIDWNNIYDMSNTQSAFTSFHDNICRLYNKHFPYKEFKLTIVAGNHGLLMDFAKPSERKINST